MAEQYFSAEPASKDVRRTLNVTLRGHEATAQVSNGVFSGSRVDLGTSAYRRFSGFGLRLGPYRPDIGV